MDRETDYEKFKELAEKRVNRALNDIRLIGNLSNKSNYYYTDADARKIYKALKDAVEDMKGRFDRPHSSRGPRFSL